MFPFPAKRGPLGRGLLSAVCPADSGKDNARQNTDYTGNQQRAVRVSGYENDAQEKQKYTNSSYSVHDEIPSLWNHLTLRRLARQGIPLVKARRPDRALLPAGRGL